MSEAHSMEKILARVGDLPAMPSVVAEVLSLTQDPSVDMAEVSEVIQKDPVLTAKILKVSNSPYYGMRQYVGTLKLSLVILGVREVRNIVLGISVLETFRNPQVEAVLAEDFWSHSFMVAGMARKLGVHLKASFQGEAFVAGLLHDIGKLVLLRQLGAAYVKLYQAAPASKPLLVLEAAGLGFTHADAAAALSVKWNFPQTLVDAVGLHHYKEDVRLADAKDPQLAAVVRISNIYARLNANGDGASKKFDPGELSEAWEVLDGAAVSIPEDEREPFLAQIVDELREESVPDFT